MKRALAALVVVFVATAAYGQAYNVEYGQTVHVPVAGATAAYSLDTQYVDAGVKDGILSLVGVTPGSTHVVVVTPAGIQEFRVTVPIPPPTLPPGFVRPSRDRNEAESGSYELRFSSDPRQLQSNLSMARLEGDRSVGLQIQSLFQLEGSAWGSAVALPLLSYVYKNRSREIDLFDRYLDPSVVTSESTLLRGLHLRQGPWEVSAGYTSMASFYNLFLPTEKQALVTASYRGRLTRRSSLKTGMTWVDWRGDSAQAGGHEGLVGSLIYEFKADPEGHKQFTTELAASRKLAFGFNSVVENERDRFNFSASIKPDGFPTLRSGSLTGSFVRGNWQRVASPKLNFFVSSNLDRFSSAGATRANLSGSTGATYLFSSHWSGGAGAVISSFNSSLSTARMLRTVNLPVSITYSGRGFAATGGYAMSHNSGGGPLGREYRASFTTGSNSFRFNTHFEWQTRVPTLDVLISSTPGLGDLLTRLGIAATSLTQIQDLLRQDEILEQLGLDRSFRLQLASRRFSWGSGLTWRPRSTRQQDVNLMYLFTRTEDVSRASTDFGVLTATYSRQLTENTNILASLSWMHQNFGLYSGSDKPTVQLSIRRRFWSVPELLMPSAKGAISGIVFRDEDMQMKLGPSSQPLAGVEVLLDATERTRTDEKGRYRFAKVPYGKHKVQVVFESERPYYFTTPSAQELGINSKADFGVAFLWAVLFGRVVDDAGTVIHQAIVDTNCAGRRFRAGATSGEGGYRLTIPGETATECEVTVDPESLPPGYRLSDITAQRVTVKAGAPAAASFTIAALRTISGAVSVHSAGQEGDQPARAALVRIDELNRETETDNNGRFVFRNLPKGQFTVRVLADGLEDHRAISIPNEPSTRRDVDFRLNSVSGARRAQDR